ncbi:MAG: tripartite tricarboxylate transporter TctB family protein [Pseudomonadota bacterium]
MNSARLQHIIPGLVVFGLAAIVTWLSFTQQPAESFLFPRVISIAFIGLATWNLIRAAAGLAKVGSGFDATMVRNIAPGLIVMLMTVFWAAKALGFYTASSLAFFAIYSIYDPVPLSSTKDWIKRLIITALFMGVIYGLFALLLQVQTPRGILL